MDLTDEDEWVFRTKPSFASRLSFELRQACAKFGIQATDNQGRSLTSHGIRHGRISHLAAIGTPVHTLQRIARHSKIATTARYLHATDDSLRVAIEETE
jgi:integrase